MVEEAVRVRECRHEARRSASGSGLREVEVLVGERVEDVIGQRGSARIGGALRRRVARLGDVEAGGIFVQMLHVADLAAAIHGDRRRQARVEELPLIVADDDHGIRGDLVEFLPQRFEGLPAFPEALAPDLHGDLVREPRRALLRGATE